MKMNLFDCEWVNNHFFISKKTIALNNQFSIFPLISNADSLKIMVDFITKDSQTSKESDKLFDLIEFENNDRHISFLGVKHLIPGNHDINDQILSSIDMFFNKNCIKARNPIIFVENVEELIRDNFDDLTLLGDSRRTALFRSIQTYSKRDLPGESYFVVQKALEYGLPVFCPEPRRVARIEASFGQALEIGDISFNHIIFYEFLTNIHSQMNASQVDRMSYADTQLILAKFIVYISNIINNYNLLNDTRFPLDVHDILKDLFDTCWVNSDIRLDDLICLLTPHIYSVNFSQSLLNISDSVINDIRKVPTFIGQFRDFNIAREVYSACQHYDVKIVYGIGHLDTLNRSFEYIINIQTSNE